mmetsp:Transcript_6296/g.7980  ORF Transcript_6296/g.7980 Transcript_6296/m.7980 type:complete len:355 (-) Transcript_6296:25-1089(-)
MKQLLRRSDYKIISTTTTCLLAILVSYHYITNIHILSSSSSSPLRHMKSPDFVRSYQYSTAYDQSYGFFTDISNQDWNHYRTKFQHQDRYVDGDIRNNRLHLDSQQSVNGEESSDESEAHIFYQNNYDIEFTCPHEMQIGTHEMNKLEKHRIDMAPPQWVCDPHRIIPMSRRRKEQENENGCLVYIFVEEEDSRRFIQHLDIVLMQQCEIHVFSPYLYKLMLMKKESLGGKISIHPWGLEGTSDMKNGRRDYLTLHETLIELDHVGHSIDILSIDCEGCEWSIYKDLFNNSDMIVTQFLIEIHKAPYQVNDFFVDMRRNGYVIVHKESNIVDGKVGQHQAYSFLRLKPEFFKSS